MLKDLDDDLFASANDFSADTPWLHPAVVAFAKFGVVLFAGLLVFAYLRGRRRGSSRELAASGWAGIATLIALAANQPLGNVVGEARPYTAHRGTLLLVSATTDFSFPSDHAVMAGAVAAGLFFVSQRLGVVAAAAAVLMAAARVYVGAHYPWDVLAGLTLGACVSIGGWLLLRKPLSRLVIIVGRTRLRPLVVARPGGHVNEDSASR
jgi:undecaprenyl-diphosphatase